MNDKECDIQYYIIYLIKSCTLYPVIIVVVGVLVKVSEQHVELVYVYIFFSNLKNVAAIKKVQC